LGQVPGSARSPPRDAAEPAGFVAVGQLPADPDRPDDVVVVADKQPAGDRHQLAGGQSDRGVDERGAGLGSGGQASAADAHVEGTGCRGPSDAFAQQARDVFPRDGHQPPGSVQHRNRHRGKVAAPCVRRGAHHNGAGGGEADRGATRIRHRTSKQDRSFLFNAEHTPKHAIAQPIVFV